MARLRRLVIALVLAGAALLGVSACDPGPACVASHGQMQWVPVWTRKTTTLHPVWVDVCDRYATGRKS